MRGSEKKQENYTESPINTLFIKIIPPSCLTYLISAAGSFVDTVVVGKYMGVDALAAVNLCIPIFNVFFALMTLISVGAATVYSFELGAGRRKRALEYFTVAGVCVLAVICFFTVLGSLYTDRIVLFLGANEALYDMAYDYSKVLFWFSAGHMGFTYLMIFVRIDFGGRRCIISMAAAMLVNIVLDILFIGKFRMGAFGAAIATSISYTMATLIMAGHFFSKKNSLIFVKFEKGLKKTLRILKTGIPDAVINFGITITGLIFNVFLINRYGDVSVAAYSAVCQLQFLAGGIYGGMADGIMPVFSANYGAGKKERIKEALRKGMICEVICCSLIGLSFIFFPAFFSSIFSLNNGNVGIITRRAIRIYGAPMIMYGIGRMVIVFYQATGRVGRAMLLSFIMESAGVLTGLFLLEKVFGLDGVWLSFLFAQTAVLSVAEVYKLKDRRKNNSSAPA